MTTAATQALTTGALLRADAIRSAAAVRRLAADRRQPDRHEFGTDRAGDYVVADRAAPGDDGTLWAATRTGRVFVTKNANDVAGAQFASTGSTRRRPRAASCPGSRSTRTTRTTPGSPTRATTLTRLARPARVRGAATTRTRTPRRSRTGRTTSATSRSPASPSIGATGDVFAATDFGVLRLPRARPTGSRPAPACRTSRSTA